MSELDSAVSKTLQGAEWRTTISVPMGDETKELTTRQLVDDEFYEISDMIDWDELEEYSNAVPSDLREQYEELSEQKTDETVELTDEEETKLNELEEEIEEKTPRIFDVLSYDTFKGLQKAAKYGIEADEEDKKDALRTKGREIEEEYGVKVSLPKDTEIYWEDQISTMVENSTNLSTFIIGMKVLMNTADSAKN